MLGSWQQYFAGAQIRVRPMHVLRPMSVLREGALRLRRVIIAPSKSSFGMHLQERCLICFESYPLHEMRSAACKHFFCKECWRGYISNALSSGPACLDLRCPSTECKGKACVSRDISPGNGPKSGLTLSAYCKRVCVFWSRQPGATIGLWFYARGAIECVTNYITVFGRLPISHGHGTPAACTGDSVLHCWQLGDVP
jgi:hypothetical protein